MTFQISYYTKWLCFVTCGYSLARLVFVIPIQLCISTFFLFFVCFLAFALEVMNIFEPLLVLNIENHTGIDGFAGLKLCCLPGGQW